MNNCSKSGEKTIEGNKFCAHCGTKVEDTFPEAVFGTEKSKGFKRYTCLAMVASLSFGVFLGSRDWNNHAPHDYITAEEPVGNVSTSQPQRETVVPNQKDDVMSSQARFEPDVTVGSREKDRKIVVFQDDFLLEYLDEDVILLDYIGTLEEVTIPEQVTIIGQEAFIGHNHLKMVIFPSALEKIEENAFAYCVKLEKIQWSEGVRFVEEGAFRHCESLRVLELPDSVEELGESSFYGCENLEILFMGASLEVIGISAFKNCWNLEKISFSDTLIEIQASAFEKCGGLKVLYLPDSLEKIEQNAFLNCISLEEVWLTADSYGEEYAKEYLPQVELKFHEATF